MNIYCLLQFIIPILLQHYSMDFEIKNDLILEHLTNTSLCDTNIESTCSDDSDEGDNSHISHLEHVDEGSNLNNDKLDSFFIFFEIL